MSLVLWPVSIESSSDGGYIAAQLAHHYSKTIHRKLIKVWGERRDRMVASLAEQALGMAEHASQLRLHIPPPAESVELGVLLEVQQMRSAADADIGLALSSRLNAMSHKVDVHRSRIAAIDWLTSTVTFSHMAAHSLHRSRSRRPTVGDQSSPAEG